MAKNVKKSKEMRIRKVPADIHFAIVEHQGTLKRKHLQHVSLDEAAIDLWRKAISQNQ